MSEQIENENASTFRWRRPQEVMRLHKLKKKKKALQARINSSVSHPEINSDKKSNLENIMVLSKRKNPFLTCSENKRTCIEARNIIGETNDESNDNALFKLFHLSSPKTTSANKPEIEKPILPAKPEIESIHHLVKAVGEKWIPIDWTLKTKIRFLSEKPFGWSQKLKISEEASGVTSFSRCLDTSSAATSLDTSRNARFHQCCLYWQQPSLPWLQLFPRTIGKASEAGSSIATTPTIRSALHSSFSDSLRSLYQLIRTRQCPYFYACCNTFTMLFRAGGVAGLGDAHALITPTTRGLREMLTRADVEFTMPLVKEEVKGEGNMREACVEREVGEVEGDVDDTWMESMGIDKEDIKQINFKQAYICQKAESQIDNSDQSLIFIEGIEVQALYNFLINSCKSIVAQTGPLAGIPPTLLAPVAFTGATLNALKVRESKVHVDQDSYYTVDISGPILPHTIHILNEIAPKSHSFTATFSNVVTTIPFSEMTAPTVKLNSSDSTALADQTADSGSAVFRVENLSDCGLPVKILRHFCSDNPRHIANIDCLKYTADNASYAWS